MKAHIRRLLTSLAVIQLSIDGFSASAATNIVTSLADYGAGSLRHIVVQASAGDVVKLGIAGTIILTNGALKLTNSVTIAGLGPTNTIITSLNASRIIEVQSNAAV